MPSVQSTSGDQHVASKTPWVGEDSLLQNDHSILDIPMHKVYLHRRHRRCSYRTALNQTAPQASRSQEGHPVRLHFLTKGKGCPTPSLLFRSPMLRPHVPHHQPKRHLLPTLLILHPSLLSLPVGRAFSRHPSPVCHLRLGTLRPAWTEEHANCLPDIGPQAHPIEQTYQGSECAL